MTKEGCDQLLIIQFFLQSFYLCLVKPPLCLLPYFSLFFRSGLSFKNKNIFVILDNFGGRPPISASNERDSSKKKK